MANSSYPEKPGSGVMYHNAPHEKKHELGPDFSGHLILEMDYKAGDKLFIGAWEKPTSRGNVLLALREDNYVRKLRLKEQQNSNEPKEVVPGYKKKVARRDDDSDVPF
jgi:hypothetical protein